MSDTQVASDHGVRQAARLIREHWDNAAEIAVVLGSGLGSFASEICVEREIPYAEIPGFPQPTAPTHRGMLVCGRLEGCPILLLAGRCHLYEGYDRDQVVFPVRVLAALGVSTLMLSNAAGGLNPQYQIGDVMLIDDHIDLMPGTGRKWWASSEPPQRAGHRTSAYDAELLALAHEIALRAAVAVHRGVYAAMSGPNYETRAEYRFLRRIGADVVGMSTVPEAIVASWLGLRVFGLSVVTNVARPDVALSVDAHDVVDVATRAEPVVRVLVGELVRQVSRRSGV